MKDKVVLVRFPFDDLSASKVRPAVCLTAAVGPHRHVALGFITSQPPGELPTTSRIVPWRPAKTERSRVFGRPNASIMDTETLPVWFRLCRFSSARRRADAGPQLGEQVEMLWTKSLSDSV